MVYEIYIIAMQPQEVKSTWIVKKVRANASMTSKHQISVHQNPLKGYKNESSNVCNSLLVDKNYYFRCFGCIELHIVTDILHIVQSRISY